MTKLSGLTGDYVLDTVHTRIGFVARHAMATRVHGRFDEFEGSAYLGGDDFELTGAENDPRGNFRVDFKGSVTINRNDWGVGWNAVIVVLVSPKVTLGFDVAAIWQS
jgi:polyisoprenoid-binding protein YceI